MSRPSTLARGARYAIGAIQAVDIEALAARMEDYAATVRATAYDRPIVTGGTPPDPTGRLRTDEPWADRKHLEQLVRDLVLAATKIRDLGIVYLGDNPARPDADLGDPGCQSCRRLRRHDGQRRWEPTHRRGTAGDRLDEPLRLCRWCYSWVVDHATPGQRRPRGEILPNRRQLTEHHEGRKVVRSAR